MLEQAETRFEGVAGRPYLEELVSQAPVPMAVVEGAELRFVLVNRAYCAIEAQTASFFLGRPMAEVFPEPEARGALRVIRQAFETGSPTTQKAQEFRLRPNGERTWWNMDYVPLHNATGQVQAVLILPEDVTEEVRIRLRVDEQTAALRESEERLKLATEAADAGTWEWDTATGVLVGSDRASAMHGLPTGMQLDFEAPFATIHPDDREAVRAALERASSRGIPYEVEYRSVWPDGTVHWLAGKGRFHGSRLLGLVQDITNRKKAEERLSQLATVVEGSSDFIGVAGLDQHALYLNPAGQAMMGLAGDEAVRATKVEDYLFPEDLPFVRETVLPTVMREGRWKSEFRLRHFQTGEPIAVDWDVFRVDDPQTGQPIKLATVTRDIRPQKAAEQAVRESEELLRLAEQAASIGSFEWDVAADRLRVSPEYAAIYGVEPGTFRDGRQAWAGLVHPEDLPAVQAHFNDLSARRESQAKVDFRILRPNGEVRWIEARVRMGYDAEGNLRRMIGINLDITERKQAEEALRASEEMLRLAEQAGDIGSFDWNVQADDLRVSAGFLVVYGVEPGTFAGGVRSWFERLHPDDVSMMEERIAEVASAYVPQTHAEFRIVRPDGQIRWIEARFRITYDPDGTLLSIVGINVDITERRQAEEALRQSEELLRLAEQAGDVGSFEWNPHRDRLRISAGYAAIYGLEPGVLEPAWEAWARLVHPDDLPWIETLIAETTDRREPYVELQFRTLHPDDRMRWVEARARWFYDCQGRLSRVIGVNVDITDRKHAEESLRASEELLRVAEQAGNVGSFEWCVQTGRLRLSAGCQAIYGFDPEAYDGTYEAWTSRLAPDGLTWIEAMIRGAFARHETQYKNEFRIVRADGQVRWLEGRIGIDYDAEGRPLRVFGAKVDVTDRKRIEEALRESEATLRGFFDASAVLMTIIELDGDDFVYVLSNPELAAVVDRTPEELAGKHARELGLPETIVAEWVEVFRDSHRTGLAISREYVFPTRGTERWYQGTISPIATSPSEPPRFALAAVDITDRKRAEEALRESEATLRGFFDANAVYMSVVEVDGDDVVYTVPNPRIAAFFGLPIDEFVGKHGRELGLPEEFAAQWAALIQECQETQRPISREYSVPYRGNEGWYYGTLSPLPPGVSGRPRCALAAVDITDRKRTEEALRESEERFRVATEATYGVVYDWNRITGLTWRSANLFDVVGYHPDEVPEENDWWRSLIHPEDLATRDPTVIPPHLSLRSVEYRVRHKDGRYVWVWDTASIVRNADGEAVRVVGNTVSIDDRKRAEENLKRLTETLEERVVERTAIAEQRASQLRVLAAELTQAEEQERRRLAKVLHDHLQQLLVAARMKVAVLRRRAEEERMTRTLQQIDEVLDQAITESRSLTVELSPPVLYDAGLGAGLEWLARQMEEKHSLRVVVSADPDAEPTDEGTRVFLFQAVRELLLNVVKHAQTDVAHVELLPLDSDRLQLVVADPGVGFDFSALEDRGISGGFGLFSIRERLELLGGQLEVETGPRLGTRMVIEVPRGRLALVSGAGPTELIAAPAVEGGACEGGRGSVGQERTRVVLADDHAIVRQGLAGLLRDQGSIEVVGEAADGRQAVEIALETRPDVVLMDVTMPGLNGIEATRRILNALPAVRVIGLSMHEEADMATAMRKAGAVAYLRKDTDTDVLVSAIHAQPPSSHEAST